MKIQNKLPLESEQAMADTKVQEGIQEVGVAIAALIARALAEERKRTVSALRKAAEFCASEYGPNESGTIFAIADELESGHDE